ncbi:MAG: hypothetical protein COB14_07575 [Alphaproteobacteria bacterium]|nr:MAG: hypothetical protein COB14_07575 [Alphaproteobacteria bacterium]
MIHICVENLLYFGDGASCCPTNIKKYAVVHACKEPCHRQAVGYSAKSLNSDHPLYLSFEKDNQLFLNMIDPPVPLFKLESFKIFLEFVGRKIENKQPILIHCNQGQSRAPSLAMLCMAKGLNLLPNDSYAAARTAFEEKFPYTPGKGISQFLEKNWQSIDEGN